MTSIQPSRVGSASASGAGSAVQTQRENGQDGEVVTLTRSLAVTMLENVEGRYRPLHVPAALKVQCRKKAVLDRSINYASLPSSYSTSTNKELAVLEYVEDFRRQFVQLFPKRQPLTLCPVNESGVRKFLPTSIRPTILPYPSVYDLAECAAFVSDYVRFMPLDDPTRLPDLLPSSATMLKVRVGDCLDLACLLLSLLRGAGFNAYAVAGYAPQWITEADQSEVVCPLLPNEEELAWKAAEEKARKEEEERRNNKYEILARPDHTSKYRAARVKEKHDIAAEAVAAEEARIRKLKERAVDPLHGKRAHAWVLVKRGRRDVTEDVFIEPSTGTIYPVSNSPYLGVDSVWNERNYWVNVQTSEQDQALINVSAMEWDLNNNEKWEYVMIDEQKYRANALARAGGGDSSVGQKMDFESVNASENNEEKELAPEDRFDDRDILDTPLPWASPIVIDRDDFTSRYPDGYKFIQYKDCTVEKWSPYYKGAVGCVRRIKIFAENKTLEVLPLDLLQIWETFQHRKDKLLERRTFLKEDRVVATYAPGLASGLQSYALERHSQHRVFTFHPGARVDGLVRREEWLGVKVIEDYENRDDFLTYRSIAVDTRPQGSRGQKVTFLPMGPDATDYPIRKLTEKYARNRTKKAEEDIQKRTHFLTQHTIRLDFHYGDNHITHSVHLLDKNDKLEQSETEGRQVGSQGYLLRVDAEYKEKSRGEEQQMVAKMLLIEKELKIKLKAREEAMIKEVIRLDEELNDEAGKIILEKSIYDVAYEQAKEAEAARAAGQPLSGSASSSRSNLTAEGSGGAMVDYLSPFLAAYPNIATKPLTRRQAQQVKDECLAALKERLLERANIIQQHLDEETQKLAQRQALFKRQAGSGAVEASEEFNKFSNQCLFRIDILNARRARHEELALRKYVELDERLNNDPRLAALHQTE